MEIDEKAKKAAVRALRDEASNKRHSALLMLIANPEGQGHTRLDEEACELDKLADAIENEEV